jgi:peptidyl-tRNA hydrolase
MSKKLKIFLAILIFLSTTLSFIILLAPKTTQKIINTWLETGQEKIIPKQSGSSESITVLEPAPSGSNPGQESRR